MRLRGLKNGFRKEFATPKRIYTNLLSNPNYTVNKVLW